LSGNGGSNSLADGDRAEGERDHVTPGGVGSVFASAGVSVPQGLAFDSAGNLYASNAGSDTITKFTPNGVGTLFANTLAYPQGLAFDHAGNLYVADRNSDTIQKFTPGGAGSVFANTGLRNPNGLAFDAAGNLYATNAATNTIEKFTPAGVGTLFANSGLNLPTFTAFAPAAGPKPFRVVSFATPIPGGTLDADDPALVSLHLLLNEHRPELLMMRAFLDLDTVPRYFERSGNQVLNRGLVLRADGRDVLLLDTPKGYDGGQNLGSIAPQQIPASPPVGPVSVAPPQSPASPSVGSDLVASHQGPASPPDVPIHTDVTAPQGSQDGSQPDGLDVMDDWWAPLAAGPKVR
jgi:hypothetical protein